MLRLSLALLILVRVTFAPGTLFYGEAGQGPVSFTEQVICSAMDSDGVKVLFTDFALGGEAYGTIGFSTAIGSSMTVSKVTVSEIKFTAAVTAAIATASVYTPGKGSPTGVTGAQSWSKVGDAMTVILPTGTHQVTISYTTQTPNPGELPDLVENLAEDFSEAITLLENNLSYIIPAIIIYYLLTLPRGKKSRIIKKARKRLG